MPQIPKLAPRFTLNLIDGDKYTIPGLIRDKETQDPLDLTSWKGALQVRKAFGDAAVILTLATELYDGFTSSDGCSIEILDQTDPDTMGRFYLIFDLDSTELDPSDFTDEGGGRYTAVYDLEFRDALDAPKKYAKGTAVLRREVTIATASA